MMLSASSSTPLWAARSARIMLAVVGARTKSGWQADRRSRTTATTTDSAPRRRSLHVGAVASKSFAVSASDLDAASVAAESDVSNVLGKGEIEAARIANDNPFDVYTVKPPAGVGDSTSNPILIPSTRSSRMVGCCCEDDYKDVVWFNLEKGGVQKCDCGVNFRLIDYDPLDGRIKPKFGGGFGSGLSTIYY